MMTEEVEYFESKRPDRTYVSRPFESPDERMQRFFSKVVDHAEHHEFFKKKDELVIRVTEGMRDEVKAIVYEDDREIQSLTIQRFTRTSGQPHKISFSFHGDEIGKLKTLIDAISAIPLPDGQKDRLDDDIVDEALRSLGDQERRRLLAGDIDLVLEVAKNDITSSDVIALRYRKEQLQMFESLLTDTGHFASVQAEWCKHGAEAVWQEFFERNPWIFGYGLQYVFTDRLGDKRLEQTVAGFSVSGRGKRADALLKTLGAVSSLCFVELKRHDAPLLASTRYRPDCWPISAEVVGAVAQIQKTVQRAAQEIRGRLIILHEDGEPSAESAFLFHPRSFVVVGNLSEFISQNGVNEEKYGSFELFRRNLTSPEILTYDELLARARCIVHHYETDDLASGDPRVGSAAPDTEADSLEEINDAESVPF